MTYVLVGWLQNQALPSVEDFRAWLSTVGIYGFGVWTVVQTVAHGKALAFLKGNTATKEALSAAVDRIRNDVTATNLAHRLEVETRLEAFDQRTDRRKGPR